MTEAEVSLRVRAFVVENFLYMRPDFELHGDDSLLRRGVFDSLGVMEVIGFLEDTFGIEVGQDEVTEANFGTLDAIARYVVRKGGHERPAAGSTAPPQG